MTGLLIRNAEVAGTNGTDILLRDGVVAALGHGIAAVGTPVLDAEGGALLPGLHDHHLHLHALAAESLSVRCGPPQVHTVEDLRRTLAQAPGEGWIRGVGYVETVAGLLDATALDAVHRHRPVRIQHRSGAMWVLNSAAADAVGLDSAPVDGVERDSAGRVTGRVWRADTWLRSRLPDTGPPKLDAVGTRLAGYGITGITDATPDLTASSLSSLIEATESGAVPQRLNLLGVPLDHPLGMRPHESSTGRTAVGAYKIVLADSDLPAIDDLVATVRRAHARSRPVAVHCVSREALLILLAVFGETGSIPGDRIEHGALIPAECMETVRRLGITVITQPGFIAHRGDDYLHRVDPVDLPDLYRCRSLCDAGVGLGLSSDAPYGPADPWQIIEAATTRREPGGAVVGPDETLCAAQALDRFLTPLDDPGGRPRRVAVGSVADLVLLDRPFVEALAQPSADAVRATFVDGSTVFLR